MDSATIREYESVTRTIARWGSVVAAGMFGIAFLTDQHLSYAIVSGQVVQIVLVSAVFFGYLLAWKNRYEVSGSVIALAAVGTYYGWCHLVAGAPLGPFFLAVALPALFHLSAVAFHRFALPARSE